MERTFTKSANMVMLGLFQNLFVVLIECEVFRLDTFQDGSSHIAKVSCWMISASTVIE